MGKKRQICQICYEDFTRKLQPVDLPCKCAICRLCFSTFLREHCQSFPSALMPCPTPDHQTVLSPTVLKSILSKRDFRMYESATLKQLLMYPIYRQCPNCHLISWTDSPLCLSTPSCPRCNYAWTTPVSSLYLYLHSFIDNFPSLVLKDLLASPCPQCYIYISKASGCDHMTCLYCGFQFCWLCRQPYRTHKEVRCAMHCLVAFCWLVLLAVLFIVHLIRIYSNELYQLAPYLCLLLVIGWIVYYFCIVLPDLISLQYWELEGVSKRWKYGSIGGFICFGVVAGVVELVLYFPLLVKLTTALFLAFLMSVPGLALIWLRFTEKQQRSSSK